MTKPTELPEWASSTQDPNDIVTPSAGRKLSGWHRNAGVPEKPPYQLFNWYMNLVYQWTAWFDSIINNVFINGGVTNITELNAAIVAAGSAEKTIKISSNAVISIISDTEIPVNVNLEIPKGAIFNVANGKKLVMRGGIIAGNYQIFSYAGAKSDNFLVDCSKCGMVSVAWFGLIADGLTDWDAEGLFEQVFLFSANNTVVIMFPSGYYRTGFNNKWSEVQMHCEAGCEFGGVMHVAIGGAGGDAVVRGVKITGYLVSYMVLGTYMCEDIYIESCHLKSNSSKNYYPGNPGYIGGGVNLYFGTNKLHIGSMIIDVHDANYSLYAFGINNNGGADRPKQISVDNLWIKNCGATALRLSGCDDVIFGQVVIDDFSGQVVASGVVLSDAQRFNIGSLALRTTSTAALDGVFLSSGSKGTINSAQIFNIPREPISFNNQNESLIAGVVNIEDCMLGGFYIGGSVLFGSYTIKSGKLRVSTEDLVKFINVGGYVEHLSIETTISKSGSFMVRASSIAGQMKFGIIEISLGVSGDCGGVKIESCSNLIVGYIGTKNCGTGSGAYPALLLDTCSECHILGGHLNTGLQQGLRLLSISGCSFQNLKISNFAENIAHSGMSSCLFLTSSSSGGTTDLSVDDANFINCTGVTA